MRSLIVLIPLLAAIVPAWGGSFTPLFSNPGGEPDLITTLDAIYGPAGYVRVSDDLDQIWTGQTSVSALALSSYAGATQRLGVCVLCDGSDDFLFDPSIDADGVFFQPLSVNGQPGLPIAAPQFRFFNDPTNHSKVGRVFSDPTLNPLGADHMVTFALNGTPNTYVLAFEDWLFTSDPSSDRDYNDFVVQVAFSDTDVEAVPEPGTALLLGCGLLLATRLARRRQAASSE